MSRFARTFADQLDDAALGRGQGLPAEARPFGHPHPSPGDRRRHSLRVGIGAAHRVELDRSGGRRVGVGHPPAPTK